MKKSDLLQEMRAAAQRNELEFLTITDVKNFKGLKIQTITFGYNCQDIVKEFYIGDIISEYDRAKKDKNISGFKNRAEYWESYMTPEQLTEMKNKKMLLTDEGKPTYIFTDNYSGGAFWCSDDDRFVNFRVYKITKPFTELSDKELQQIYSDILNDKDSITPLNFGMIDKDVPAYAMFNYYFEKNIFKSCQYRENHKHTEYDIIEYPANRYDADIKRYLDAVKKGIIPRLSNCIL